MQRMVSVFEGVLIAVEDSGTGLDATPADGIFEAMFTKPEGMSMGLSISRSIIAAHRGRIWASPGERFGTIFQIVLPSERSIGERMHSMEEYRGI
jgi:signal transduction histidine kinase